MKQLLFLLLLIPFFSFSNNIEISRCNITNEGNFVTYKAIKEESIPDIAKKFCVKTAMLLKFNNVSLNDNIKINQTISIPLTETNYFKLSGIKNSAGFIPIYYFLESNTIKKNLCVQLGILVQTFDKWNHTEHTDKLISGEEFFIGWLKIDTNTQINITENEIRRKEITKNLLIGDHKMHPSYETPSKIANGYNTLKEKKKISPIQKRLNKFRFNPNKIKKLYGQSLANIKKTFKSIFTNKDIIIKDNKPTTDTIKNQEIVTEENSKVNSESKISIKKEIESTELKKIKEGNASLFYAGNRNGKFYVVTNIAAKGATIKVTNTKNGKNIMAEVIGGLSNEDINKGILIRISDNSKLPLVVTNKIFYVKVNY